MLVMTAKVNKKKIAVIASAVLIALIALILMLSGGSDAQATAAMDVTSNDTRVAFLKSFGWEVTTSPVQSGQVRIPETDSEIFRRYNELQKSQGYDLTQYAGKTVMRYVYQINNYPGATQPVYATLLVYKNQVIGGDVTDSAPGGRITGLKMTHARIAPSE